MVCRDPLEAATIKVVVDVENSRRIPMETGHDGLHFCRDVSMPGMAATLDVDLPNVCQQWFGFGSVTERLTPLYTVFSGIFKAPPVGLEPTT